MKPSYLWDSSYCVFKSNKYIYDVAHIKLHINSSSMIRFIHKLMIHLHVNGFGWWIANVFRGICSFFRKYTSCWINKDLEKCVHCSNYFLFHNIYVSCEHKHDSEIGHFWKNCLRFWTANLMLDSLMLKPPNSCNPHVSTCAIKNSMIPRVQSVQTYFWQGKHR